MRKLLTILLIFCGLWAGATESRPLAYSMILTTSKILSTTSIAYTETNFATGHVRFWTNYTWSNTNGNIVISNANYPSLTQGDTIFINPFNTAGLGYRSYSINKAGYSTWTNYATVYWKSGAYINPSTSSIQANSIDSSNWIMTDGMVMNDHIDKAFTSYANKGYSHHMYFKNFTGRGMNGFFPSVGTTFANLPSFTGDSVNCFYAWTFDNIRMDSLIGENSGEIALRLGGIALNQFWIYPRIINSYFGHYNSSAPGGPASYIQFYNCWGAEVYNTQFEQLGRNAAVFVGHAAVIFGEQFNGWIHDNLFGPDNFGTRIRVYGQSDLNVSWVAKGTIISGNKDLDNIKYSHYESRQTPADITTLSPWVTPRKSAELWNLTYFNNGIGARYDKYGAAAGEYYEPTDTITQHNIIVQLCKDSIYTAAYGPNLRMYSGGSGFTGRYDTSNNLNTTDNYGGFVDSVNFIPSSTGFLFNKGRRPLDVRVMYLINYNLSGPGISIGAIKSPIGDQVRRCTGCKIKWQ